MMKNSVKKITVVSIKRPKEYSHRSRRKRKIRSEETIREEKIDCSTKSIENRKASTKSNYLTDVNVQEKKEEEKEKDLSTKQMPIDENLDLGTIDDILIETHQKAKKKFSLLSIVKKNFFILLIIFLLIIVVAAIVLPTMLLLYPMTTTTTTTTMDTSSFNWNTTTTTSISQTTTTSMTTRTTTTTTSTSTTTASTVTITSNICTASWTGISMIAYCRNCPLYPAYYPHSYNYTAIATTTRLAFAFRGQNGYFALDDISVRNSASPNTEILINGGFEMGNLTSWGICDQYNASTNSGVKNNLTNFTYSGLRYYARTGLYYFVGGTSNSTDYISQTFSTIIGNLYLVTFGVMVGVNGSMSSGDFFLGV